MGFTVDTEQKLDQAGISLTGLYYSFQRACRLQGSYVEAKKIWTISGQYAIYGSLLAYNQGLQPLIRRVNFSTTVESLTNVEPYETLYDALKASMGLINEDVTDYIDVDPE